MNQCHFQISFPCRVRYPCEGHYESPINKVCLSWSWCRLTHQSSYNSVIFFFCCKTLYSHYVNYYLNCAFLYNILALSLFASFHFPVIPLKIKITGLSFLVQSAQKKAYSTRINAHCLAAEGILTIRLTQVF